MRSAWRERNLSLCPAIGRQRNPSRRVSRPPITRWYRSIDRSTFRHRRRHFRDFPSKLPSHAKGGEGGGKCELAKPFKARPSLLIGKSLLIESLHDFHEAISNLETSSFLTFSPDLDLPLAGRTNVELYLLCSLFSNLSFHCSFYGRNNVKFHLGWKAVTISLVDRHEI